MRRLTLLAACLLALASPAAAGARVLAGAHTSAPACGFMAGSPVAISHVVVIVMENHSYRDLIGPTGSATAARARYVNQLKSACGLATRYHALTPPVAAQLHRDGGGDERGHHERLRLVHLAGAQPVPPARRHWSHLARLCRVDAVTLQPGEHPALPRASQPGHLLPGDPRPVHALGRADGRRRRAVCHGAREGHAARLRDGRAQPVRRHARLRCLDRRPVAGDMGAADLAKRRLPRRAHRRVRRLGRGCRRVSG